MHRHISPRQGLHANTADVALFAEVSALAGGLAQAATSSPAATGPHRIRCGRTLLRHHLAGGPRDRQGGRQLVRRDRPTGPAGFRIQAFHANPHGITKTSGGQPPDLFQSSFHDPALSWASLDCLVFVLHPGVLGIGQKPLPLSWTGTRANTSPPPASWSAQPRTECHHLATGPQRRSGPDWSARELSHRFSSMAATDALLPEPSCRVPCALDMAGLQRKLQKPSLRT